MFARENYYSLHPRSLQHWHMWSGLWWMCNWVLLHSQRRWSNPRSQPCWLCLSKHSLAVDHCRLIGWAHPIGRNSGAYHTQDLSHSSCEYTLLLLGSLRFGETMLVITIIMSWRWYYVWPLFALLLLTTITLQIASLTTLCQIVLPFTIIVNVVHLNKIQGLSICFMCVVITSCIGSHWIQQVSERDAKC